MGYSGSYGICLLRVLSISVETWFTPLLFKLILRCHLSGRVAESPWNSQSEFALDESCSLLRMLWDV
ncbi:hypothetical protein EMIT0196MI5_370011 [Pseudomonas sp. IT-196MI5]